MLITLTSKTTKSTISKFRNTCKYFWSKKRNFGEYALVEPAFVTKMKPVPITIRKPDYYKSGSTMITPEEPEIKNAKQIQRMRESCKLAAQILNKIGKFIRVGITTDEVDSFAHNLIIANRAYPSPLNYKQFPKSICTSVNNVACHGIPDCRPLLDGDIINVDVTVFFNGYHGDCSKTFLVGNVDQFGRDLVKATETCLYQGISVCKPGERFSTIGQCIERKAYQFGYSVVPCFVGHGIGKYFHGPPDICHFANYNNETMEPGMTFTIEPVLSQGSQEITILEDGWTAITTDGARTAQFEHTVLITQTGVEILTEE
ncbi:methionine aminopeptidase 1D, mitochondrial [Onthophagus taurus]|uniref:methionine aminopeptidase 1D, mitochondrial n=1 Tax=Onthophagus taurus TaxID=166361 RepID=UPI0039BEA6EF